MSKSFDKFHVCDDEKFIMCCKKTDLHSGQEPACSRINQLADRMFVHPAKKRFNSTCYFSLGRIARVKMKNLDPKV